MDSTTTTGIRRTVDVPSIVAGSTKAESDKARDVINRELKSLAVSHGGKLTPEAVVKAAKPARHPLHRFFEWDNGVAGEQWRLDQARRMIMAAKFVVEVVEERARPPSVRSGSVRTWIPEGKRTRVFRERSAVLSEKEQRMAWIDERISELRAWCNSVIDVKELKTIRVGVETLLAEYEGK